MPTSRYPNARVTLVHLRGAPKADHFLIAPVLPGFSVGRRVHVQLPDGTWHAGVVDDREPSESGGCVMVTLEVPPTTLETKKYPA